MSVRVYFEGWRGCRASVGAEEGRPEEEEEEEEKNNMI